MNQIVFVVIDHEEKKVLGVFNDEITAKQVAMDNNKTTYVGNEISITPVLVDTVNWVTMSRKFWLTEEQVTDAVQEEIEMALPCDDEEEEDEDIDEEDEEDDPSYDDRDDFIQWYMKLGYSLDEANEMADKIFQ